MGRPKAVTRTVKITKLIVLCLNLDTEESFKQALEIPGIYVKEKDLMKKVSKMLDSDSVKAVKILEMEETEALYGMTEEEFVKVARKINSRFEKLN